MDKDYFALLHNMDFNMDKLFVMRQYWKDGQRFSMNHQRPTEGLLLFAGSEGTLYMEGRPSVEIPCGALVHIGRGSQYAWEFRRKDSEKPSTYLFEFTLSSLEGEEISLGDEVTLLDEGRYELYEQCFLRLLEEKARPEMFPGAFRQEAYRLLNEVIRHAYQRTRHNVDTALILKGIEYLEEDPLQEKSIPEIAEMCGVSTNYFERLFYAYAGVTPVAFRNERRLQKAEDLLLYDNISLSQIAEMLGFTDGAYFCRVFRKKYGISPGRFRSLHFGGGTTY